MAEIHRLMPGLESRSDDEGVSTQHRANGARTWKAMSPPASQANRERRQQPAGRIRRTNDQAEIDQLKAEVHCGRVLEQQAPPWQLDRRQSTRNALKYRRGAGEILIVNHGGRGWWDPMHPAAKGDVFGLIQHLDPGLNFGEARQLLRRLAGIAPAYPEHLRHRTLKGPPVPVFDRWCARQPLAEGTPTWRYLTEERCLPSRILALAAWHGLIREGPGGSAWFAHQDQASKLTGIEMRGPRWRGFSTDSDKSLFQLPGGEGAAPRLAVVEAPIDALSLASLEGPRSDTLYLATAGGLGPTTIAALRALLAKRVDLPVAQLVAATDADGAGEHYAAFLAGLAREAGVTCQRLRPPRALGDWNAILVRAGGRDHRRAA